MMVLALGHANIAFDESDATLQDVHFAFQARELNNQFIDDALVDAVRTKGVIVATIQRY